MPDMKERVRNTTRLQQTKQNDAILPMAEKEKDLIADQDEVLKYLTSVMRGKSNASVLARDSEGADQVIQKPPDEKERLKAAELLGKRYGLYTDRIEQEVDMELSITVDYGEGVNDAD